VSAHRLSFFPSYLLWVLISSAAWGERLGAASSEDFSLKVESSGGTKAVVVGSWSIDGVQGWSWGLCHDPLEAAIDACSGLGQEDPCSGNWCNAVSCPEDIRTAGPQGGPPDFHNVKVFEDGVVQAVVIDYSARLSLPSTDRFAMLSIRYTLKAKRVDLRFCDTLGEWPVRTVFVVGGRSIPPAVKEGLTLRAEVFRRGDSNADGAVNLADAIAVLSHLFAGEELQCLNAADTNDDEKLNVADAVRLLAYLFAGAPALPSPFGSCGPDPTPGPLTCLSFPPCRL